MTLSGTEPGESPAPRISGPSKAAQRLSAAFLVVTEAGLDAALAMERFLHSWHIGEGRNPRRCRLCRNDSA